MLSYMDGLPVPLHALNALTRYREGLKAMVAAVDGRAVSLRTRTWLYGWWDRASE
jgi:hypothetical protein